MYIYESLAIGKLDMRVFRCDKYVCKVFLPYSTLVLVPRSDTFEFITVFPVLKRLRHGVIVELPRKSILRVGRSPNAKYYLLDGELIELKGKRAKILGMNIWGWHYYDPRTNRKIVTVIFLNGVFKAIEVNLP